MSDASKRREQITRINIEMDPTTREWMGHLKTKYDCDNWRELVFLALRFMDETPQDQLPFEVLGVTDSRWEKLPTKTTDIRWGQIVRLQHEINSLVVRTNKDKETLTKMIGELRRLLDSHSKDRAAELVEELEELKEMITK